MRLDFREMPSDDILRVLKALAPSHYHCTRPPGPTAAVIVPANKALAPIFSGVRPPDGAKTCIEVGCQIVDGHCVRCIHAERGALLEAARTGVPTSGAVVYSLLKPCYECTKELIAAGVLEFYYAGAAYDDAHTRFVMSSCGVEAYAIDIGLNYPGLLTVIYANVPVMTDPYSFRARGG